MLHNREKNQIHRKQICYEDERDDDLVKVQLTWHTPRKAVDDIPCQSLEWNTPRSRRRGRLRTMCGRPVIDTLLNYQMQKEWQGCDSDRNWRVT